MFVEKLDDLPLFCDYWKDWRVAKVIGKGSYGIVYRIERKDATMAGSVNAAALKWIRIPKNRQDADKRLSQGASLDMVRSEYQAVRDRYQREIVFLDALRGENNIVSYQNAQESERENDIGWDILVEMELLRPIVNVYDRQAVPESEVIRIGMEIGASLDACHRNRIIHRDVKLDNIFRTGNNIYKLGDFGRALWVGELQTEAPDGNLEYMAPETYRTGQYTESSDQYALGIALYRLMNEKREPFVNVIKTSVTANDQRRAQDRRFSGEALQKPSRCSQALWGVIERTCAFGPEGRFPNMRSMIDALNAIGAEPVREPEPNQPGRVAVLEKREIIIEPEKAVAEKKKPRTSMMPVSRWLAAYRQSKNKYIIAAPAFAAVGVCLLLISMPPQVQRLSVEQLSAFEAIVSLPEGTRDGTLTVKANGNRNPVELSGGDAIAVSDLVPGVTYHMALERDGKMLRKADFATGYPDAWEETFARIKGASLLKYDAGTLQEYSLPYIIQHRNVLTEPVADGVIKMRALPTWSVTDRYALYMNLERVQDGAPSQLLRYTITLTYAGGGAYAISGDWMWPESGLYLVFEADLTPLLDEVWMDRGEWTEDNAELSVYLDGRLARTLDIKFAPAVAAEMDVDPLS